MNLDDAQLRDLINFTDEHGVLSFYAGHTPDQAADRQPTAPIEIRNQIKQLIASLEDRDRDLARVVSQRISKVGGEIDALVDGHAPGRGRALFVGVDSGDTSTITIQMPFRERVVHHDSAYIRPLVAALDEGRPAGVLVVSRARTKTLRWSFGKIEVLDEREFELGDAQTADINSAAASPSNTPQAVHGLSTRERFEERIEESHHRFLRSVVEDVATEANREGWDRLVISGPTKVRDVAKSLVPTDHGLRVLLAEQAWEDVNPNVVAEQLWPLLRSVHRQRERELVDDAINRALAGQAGAVGLRHVCEALNEGRVEHLLFDSTLQLEGYRSEEGTVHARVEGFIAEADVPLHREPLFVERMIEKAVSTSAKVTPVDDDAAEPLGDHEGVAAILRW